MRGQRRALTRQHLGEGVEGGVVGDVAGAEEQGALLLVQVGDLPLQLLVVGRVARDVASAARPRPVLVQRLPEGKGQRLNIYFF